MHTVLDTFVVMVLHCIFESFQGKAHYERVMETKVLGPITTAESELTRLQQPHQVTAV